MLRVYYSLTKPGIIYGNLLTVAAGFFLASKWQINLVLFGATLAGIALVIASACVFNNYIDRDIDEKMERTKNRALAAGLVPVRNAILYAVCLGVSGFALLLFFTNLLTAIIGLVAFVDYVILYGISKRRSVHGTLVGSISGAATMVGGYTAVTSRFDAGALILFLIMVFWQMPHFYAIAIYRLKDYQAAGIPVLPVVKGIKTTKIQILVYIIAFIAAAVALTLFGYAGYSYLVAAVLLGFIWLWLSIKGFRTNNDVLWARKLFFFSLVVLLSVSVAISAGPLLP